MILIKLLVLDASSFKIIHHSIQIIRVGIPVGLWAA